MQGSLMVRSPRAQLGLFMVLFGSAYVVTIIGIQAVLMVKGLTPTDLETNSPQLIGLMKWIQGISSLTVFFLPAYIYSRVTFGENPLYHLGIRPAQKRVMYWLAVLCILFAFPFVFWLGDLNQQLPLPDWMKLFEKSANSHIEAFLKANSGFDVFINVLIIALLPAIGEELCFRGALQRILIQLFKNAWVGIIVASIIFSALHLQFLGFMPRLFLGIVLGALYWYSGSLWPSIIAHFVNNAVQVIAVSYSTQYIEKNPSLPLLVSLLSGVTVFFLLWIYQRLSTSRLNRSYLAEQ